MPKTTGTSSCAPERQRPRLLVRIDANHTIGAGHAVRTGALAGMLSDAVEVVVAGGDAALLERFFPAARLCPLADGLDSVMMRERPDVVLVDLPSHDAALWSALRATGARLAVIDDEGGTVPADLIVNGTVLPQYHRYDGLPAGARVLAGADYTLLRPAFGRTPWRGGNTATAILVGSGERAREWAFRLAEGGPDMADWGTVTMVVGAAFPDRERLAEACRVRGIDLRWGLDAQAMAELLAGARVALMTGGMVVYEALAVGVPIVAFPQVPNLIPEAAWFAERGVAIDLGYDGGMDMARVGREVTGLHRDPATAAGMAARARRTVDGRGMERAASAIHELIGGKPR